MLRRISRGSLVAGLALGSAITLLAAPGSPGQMPRRHSPGLDGDPVTAFAAPGTTWTAWAYRDRGEFSIALARLDADGRWSEPMFLGLADGLDQVSPALVADAAGHFYLAFEVRETGTIHVAALQAGRQAWFAPREVSGGTERASAPALRVVDGRLVLAYQGSGRTIRILDWPLLPPSRFDPDGIQEGPDGFPLPTKQAPVKDEMPDDRPSKDEDDPKEATVNGQAPPPGMR